MKNFRKLLATTMALLMIMSFVPGFAATVPSADGITLSRTSSYITVGMTVQLTADASVTWSTSNNAVATVSESGLVTAVSVGKADITATTEDGKTAVCKVDVYDIEIRNHVSTPTPDLNGGQFLTDLFDAEKFKVMLTFDDTAEDVTGNVNTTVKDTLAYTDGFNGKAASFKDGYVELTDAVLGDDSITISTWLKPQTVTTTNEMIISTTPLNPGSNIKNGFYTSLKSTAVDIFYIRTGYEGDEDGFRRSESLAIGTDTPLGIYDGWVNLTWVFDKENKKMYTYIDYEQVMAKKFVYPDAVWDGEWAPLLGRGTKNGSTNFNTYKYDGLMDDFFIYDGAMTASDIAKLKSYYKLVQAVPTEGISISSESLSLSINENATLTATVTPANATRTDVIWATSNANVATVNDGMVRAIGAGNAVITATTVDGGFIASCNVAVSEEVEPFRYDRVCVIGVDGGGAWINDDYMTNVNRIFKTGATTETCRVALPSVSGPGWGSIIHGVTPEYHKVNNYTGADKDNPYPEDSPYPSFFRVLREANPDAKMASFASYATINVGIIEESLGVHEVSYADAQLQPKILSYLETNSPEILFIHYGEADHIGHQKGYGSTVPEYVETMKIIDGQIGEVYDAYAEKGLLDGTLFIVTADHGGTLAGSHGLDSEEEMNVFLGLQGPGVKKNSEILEARHFDVAAIVAHAFGLERPDGWMAKVPDGAFDGVFGQVRNEVPYPGSDYRDHINTTTPRKEGSHLTDIFGEENFDFLYEFDDNAEDTAGNRTTTVNGTITYEEGYFGKGADLSNGSITLDKFALGGRDITIGAWMKTDGFDHRRIFMTNRHELSGTNGFYISADENKFTMALQDDSGRTSFSNNYYPYDMNDGWTHVMFVYDYEEGEVRLYYDFEIYNGADTTRIIDGEIPITIGTLPSLPSYYQFTGAVDDVFMYDGAMTEEEIAQLQTYYEREGTALHVNDVEFGNSVSFDFVVDGDITDSYLYAAIYDEDMKLINVKKIPARSAGGESVLGGVNAKYLKAFVIDSNLIPKSVPATATKE